MPPARRFELSGDQQKLQALGKALKAEANGKELRRDLLREMKKPLAPAVAEIKAGLMSVGQADLPRGKESLRRAVARRIRTEVRLSGFKTGVNVRARKTPAVRDFENAPRKLNRASGWRHPVFGNRDIWVTQYGEPGYFDDPLTGRRDEFRQAVKHAMDATAQRLADQTRG